jgi:hypothetical protein
MDIKEMFYLALAVACALVCLFSIPANVGLFGMITPVTVISAVLTFYFVHKTFYG